MSKVGCIEGLTELLVCCLGVSVLEVYLDEGVKKNMVTSGFVLKVMIRGSFFVSVLQLSKTPCHY